MILTVNRENYVNNCLIKMINKTCIIHNKLQSISVIIYARNLAQSLTHNYEWFIDKNYASIIEKDIKQFEKLQDL